MTSDPSLGIRGVRLLNGERTDLLIRDGVWAKVGPGAAATADRQLPLEGTLLILPLVDSHFHLDSVYALEQTGENRSGTLWEGIRLWREYKFKASVEEISERAGRYLERAIRQGIRAIRSHVDISVPGLAGVHALLELKERFRDRIDIQLVAFPQDGYLRCEGNRARMSEALDLGVEVVGGIPHYEETTASGTASIRELMEIASERNLGVDFHCDETDDPESRHVETVARETIRLGMQGRVTVSHVTSLHSVDNAWFDRLLPLMREAELQVIANPLINVVLQGRGDTYPKRRGLTRVKEFFEGGLTVAFGHDCVRDPWYPLGDGDMLDVARMGLHLAQLTGSAEMPLVLEAVTTHPARIMNLQGTELAEGQPAHGLFLKAESLTDLLSGWVERLCLLREGRVLFGPDAP